MGNRKINEMVRVDQAIAPADYATTDLTSAYFPMTNYRQVSAVLNTESVAAGKIATVQLLQAKDASGTTPKALSAAVSKTAAAGGEAFVLMVEANASQMDEDYTHVAVKITNDHSSAVNGSAVLIRAEGRFGTDRP